MAPKSTPAKTKRPLRIAFLHPDLGIGGAERLVVDAALSLQNHGHNITIYTAHHDRSHCFIETNDGTLKVHVYGDWLPQSILKKAHIICAILRNLYVAMVILFTSLWSPYDVLFIDQLSISIPLLRLTSSRILFYCHHPDMLLTQRTSLLKKLYRIPVDLAEEFTTGLSDRIVVNSQYTQEVFTKTFKYLTKKHPNPTIVYPSINLERYKDTGEWKVDAGCTAIRDLDPLIPLFVSINRFERKKNIGLAITALSQLPSHTPLSRLIIAGGYDDLNRENIEYYPELQELAKSHDLSISDYPDMSGRVIFLRSFSDTQRTALLARAQAIIYTPANEHFGIVPIEAMYAGRPVIAVNNGGPLESMKHKQTGYLCEPNPQAFAQAMYEIVSQPKMARDMGTKGHTRVESQFSLTSFGNQVNTIINEMFVAIPSRYNLIRIVMILLLWFIGYGMFRFLS